MLINTFQNTIESKYVAMDTETHTYIDGVIIPESKIREMMKETVSKRKRNGEVKTAKKYPVSWWRKHTTVKAWAYIIYAPEGFAILENFEEYARFCAQYKVKVAWWYNAPFDFSALDWEKLSSGWTFTEKAENPREFSELASEYGARYTMTEIFPYNTAYTFDGRPSRKKQKVTHYDLRNLLKGGLRKLLELYDVRDQNGEPVRKREMDYQSAGNTSLTADDLLYMLDDARGLWWLVQKFGSILREKYGITITDGRPEVMTASGLAKKLLLRKMYPHCKTDRGRAGMYQKYHPITLELDAFYRERSLLQGGLVMLNPAIKEYHLTRVNLYRFDYNSHYPAIMHDMPDITGYAQFFDGEIERPEWALIRIFEVDEIDASVKPGFIPAWLNPITRKVDPFVSLFKHDKKSFLIFDFELEELRKWYDIPTIHILRTIIYKGRQNPAFAEFVDEHYNDKQAASARGDKVGKEIPKLLLNGVTGKFSQNPNHPKMSRIMTPENFVTLDRGEENQDPESLMNIVQGAYITAQGRTKLRQSARAIAEENGLTVAECLLYTDTDSLHTNRQFSGTDPLKLGYLKQENKKPITEAIFIAPKAYAEREADSVEFHSKGVNTECLENAYKAGRGLGEIYKPGAEYLSLSALNVQGGKALLPLIKRIKRKAERDEDEAPDEMYF